MSELKFPSQAVPLTTVPLDTPLMTSSGDVLGSVTVGQVADRAAEKVQIDGGAIPAIKGGATPETAVALPNLGAGTNKYFEASWGYWKYNNVVLTNPNGTQGIPDGSEGVLFWNGTTQTWSISKVQALPVASGTNVVVEGGLELVNQDGVFKAVDPVVAGIVPNVFYETYIINHSAGLTGIYNANGTISNAGTTGYWRTHILQATSTKIRIRNISFAFNLLFFNDENVFVSSTLLKIGDGVYDMPVGATRFAFNLEHPSYQTSTVYDVRIDEQKTSVKAYVDLSTASLSSLPKSKSLLVDVVSSMKLPGVYNATGQVINSGLEGMYRSPLIPIDSDFVWVEGMMYNFNVIFFNENQQFIELKPTINGGYSGYIASTVKYLAFTLEHPLYQTRNDYKVKISINRKDVASYIEEVLNRQYFDLIGKNVVYADDWTDIEDSDKINKAIYQQAQSLNGGSVVLKDRTYLTNKAIIMYDNVELLLDNSTLKHKDGVFDNLIRASSVTPNPSDLNGLCLKPLGVTKNIKILGINNSKLEGGNVPYSAANPKTGVVEPWIGDYYGWRTILLLFSNVKDYEISGFTISKTYCWAISQEWGCDGGSIHDIVFNTNVKNGDGIDIRNGCRNIKIWNISGSTSDDTVAMTALDASFNWDNPSGPYIYPLQTVGFDYDMVNNGIENITINNVNCAGAHHVIIMLATNTKIKGINISNISDGNNSSSKTEVIRAYSSYGQGYVSGNISDVSIYNVIGNKVTNYVVDINVDVARFRINKLRKLSSTGLVYRINPGSVDVQVSNY